MRGQMHGTKEASMRVMNSRFVNNIAGYSGGAIDFQTSSSLLVSGSEFVGNRAGKTLNPKP
eukprot:2885954-Rhodomonas_salina.5